MVNLFFLLPSLFALTSSSTAQHGHHVQQECLEPASIVASTTTDNDIMAKMKPSPECWMGAIKAMHLLERGSSAFDTTTDSSHVDDPPLPPPLSLGSVVCTAMTHNHKKALALELARCQMEDVGRPLFEEDDDDDNHHVSATDNYCSRPIGTTSILHSCLARMTTVGMHAYSLFFTHVHQSCMRLTQEHLMQASQVATAELHSMLAHHSEIWNVREERDQELRAHHENMMQSLWRKAEEREQDLAELTKNMETTADRIKPILEVESLVSMASNGVTWLTSLCFFLFVMNAVWLLTLGKRHDSTRRFMFRIACIEAMLEFVLHWMVTQQLLADSERVEGISNLRSWTLALEGVAYVGGLVLSIFRKPATAVRGEGQENAMNETLLQVMRLIAENADVLRREESPQSRRRAVHGEVTIPRRMQQPLSPAFHDAAQDDELDDDSTAGFISLPPMLTQAVDVEPTSRVATRDKTPSREALEQAYAAAYQDAVRAISGRASVSAAAAAAAFHHHPQVGAFTSPPHHDEVPPDSPPQVVIAAAQVTPNQADGVKGCKKRSVEEDGDDDDEFEEPTNKRARLE